jgi:hypothetical protein
MMSQYPLNNLHELGSGPRTSGCFRGPVNQTSPIWVGRPPTMHNGLLPNVLSLAMPVTGTFTPGSIYSTTIDAECGDGFGGVIKRRFSLGGGLSVDLGAGSFAHVKVRAITPIPENCTLYFNWVNELNFSSSNQVLSSFLDYPAANVEVQIPEGAFLMTPELSCQVTFPLTQFGTTFTQGVAAGQSIPVRFGTFRCNIVNKFFFQLRGF